MSRTSPRSPPKTAPASGWSPAATPSWPPTAPAPARTSSPPPRSCSPPSPPGSRQAACRAPETSGSRSARRSSPGQEPPSASPSPSPIPPWTSERSPKPLTRPADPTRVPRYRWGVSVRASCRLLKAPPRRAPDGRHGPRAGDGRRCHRPDKAPAPARQSRTNAGQDRPDTRITISTVTVPWHAQPLTLPPGR